VGSRLLAAPVRAGALFGLLVGSVMTVYPTFLPVITIAFALAMAIHLARHRLASLRTVLTATAITVLAVVVFAPVSLAKNVSYASAVSRGQLNKPADEAVWEEPVVFATFGKRVPAPVLKDSFPIFLPPAETAPTWVLQSRQRYDLPPLEDTSLLDAATLGILVPALVVVLAAAGVLRWRSWAFLLLGVLVSLGLSYYGYQAQDCSYCGQRALLAIPSIVAVLACCGLVATAAWIRRRTAYKGAGVVAVVAGLILVGTAFVNDRALAVTLVDGGYVLRDEAREVFDAAEGEVLVEGAGAGNPYTSYFEENLLPLGVRDATGQRPLLDWKGLAIAIFPEQYPPGRVANPDYRFVFTRLGDIRTDRRVVVQRGPYAIEERLAPLDVTVVSGVVADIVQRDPRGSAWVTGPITLLVADLERAPAYVTLELTGPAAESLRLAGPGDIVREAGRATVCVPTRSSAPVRRVRVPLRFKEGTYMPPAHAYEPPIPSTSLELESLSAARECPRQSAVDRVDQVG
jgi:hypothetical protein